VDAVRDLAAERGVLQARIALAWLRPGLLLTKARARRALVFAGHRALVFAGHPAFVPHNDLMRK
jgi:hypothetical protein